MTILSELLEDIKKSDFDEQVKIICQSIQNEETDGVIPDILDSGTTMLCLPMENDYIVLEKEFVEKYIVVRYSTGKNDTKKIPMKTWNLSEAKPEKLLKKFAGIHQFLLENM